MLDTQRNTRTAQQHQISQRKLAPKIQVILGQNWPVFWKKRPKFASSKKCVCCTCNGQILANTNYNFSKACFLYGFPVQISVFYFKSLKINIIKYMKYDNHVFELLK